MRKGVWRERERERLFLGCVFGAPAFRWCVGALRACVLRESGKREWEKRKRKEVDGGTARASV